MSSSDSSSNNTSINKTNHNSFSDNSSNNNNTIPNNNTNTTDTTNNNEIDEFWHKPFRSPSKLHNRPKIWLPNNNHGTYSSQFEFLPPTWSEHAARRLWIPYPPSNNPVLFSDDTHLPYWSKEARRNEWADQKREASRYKTVQHQNNFINLISSHIPDITFNSNPHWVPEGERYRFEQRLSPGLRSPNPSDPDLPCVSTTIKIYLGYFPLFEFTDANGAVQSSSFPSYRDTRLDTQSRLILHSLETFFRDPEYFEWADQVGI